MPLELCGGGVCVGVGFVGAAQDDAREGPRAAALCVMLCARVIV